MATRYRSSFAKMGVEAKEELVRRLARLGKEAITYAFESGFRSVGRRASEETRARYEAMGKDPNRAWDDVSFNLRDSFGSAVYVDGVLRSDTISFVNDAPMGGASHDGIDPRSGRQALLDYFNKIHPNKGENDVTLVCAVAMYYVKFLEEGTHAGRYKIKVISGASSYLRQNWERAVDGVYASLKIKKPSTRVIKGDIQPLKDYGYYE